MRVLVIEDDQETASFLRRALKEQGHVAEYAADGQTGLELARANAYDVLDRRPDAAEMRWADRDRLAPRRGDQNACADLKRAGRGRRPGQGPARRRRRLSHQALCLQRAARPHRGARAGAPSPEEGSTRFVVGDLVLDRLSHKVTRAGEPIMLQPREFRLLEYLMKHAGQVVTRTMLLENVWDYHFDPQTNVIDVHVSRLRSKIDKNLRRRCCTPSAAPATPSVTALTKLFRTTTFRLSLTYLALFGAAAAVAIFYIYWNTTVLLTRQLHETIDAELKGLAEQYTDGGLTRLVRTVADRSQTPGNSLYFVADATGRRVAGNLTSISRELLDSLGPVEFEYSRAGGRRHRNQACLCQCVQAARRLPPHRRPRHRGSARARARDPLGHAVGAWRDGAVRHRRGYLVSRNLLARIDAVAATTRTIMEGDLTGRLPVNGSGDELDRLSESLNLMLARIEQLMAGLREVSDNIAHDLKTPLNRLRNRVEAALHEPYGEPAYREALEHTIEEADGLIKTFNALLSIARLEAGAGGDNKESLDVAGARPRRGGALRAGGGGARHRAEGRSRSSRCSYAPIANCSARPLPISSTMRIKYGAPDRAQGGNGSEPEVSVTTEARGPMAEIVVTDRGPGVPSSDRERVLGRFVRLEASRSEPGSGLGLSLVSAVARLHGGVVRLEDNQPRAQGGAVPCRRRATRSAQWSRASGAWSRVKAGVTAFFKRIAEPPAIYDAARGADILDTLTKALGRRREPCSCRRALARRPEGARPARGLPVRGALPRRARPARSQASGRLPHARSRRSISQRLAPSLPPRRKPRSRRRRSWPRSAAISGGSRSLWDLPILAASGRRKARCGP